MPLARPVDRAPLLAAAALAVVVLLTVPGCTAIAGSPEPRPVIVEGIVVPGETWRVDPLDALPEEWSGPGLAATITLENVRGERIDVTSDESGRFRVGPVALSGETGDRLLISCPGRRGLCLSALDTPSRSAAGRTDGPAIVRWRISLPDLGGDG